MTLTTPSRRAGALRHKRDLRALANARPVTGTALGADNVPFTTEATNMGLLAAMSCNHPGGPLGCPGPLNEPASNNGEGTWNWEAVGGIFTINRSLKAPYFNAEKAPWGLGHGRSRRGPGVRNGSGRGIRRGH